MKDIISIDIGSTYTKGVLLQHGQGNFFVLKKETTPTTADLSDSFLTILNRLTGKKIHVRSDPDDSFEIFTSSSAKGGLSMCAIGLVPDLTLSIARLTALCAGARLTGEYAFKLNEDHIAQLEKSAPDIILFSGGTDGGNEEYLIHNARLIGESSLQSIILYCGNNAIHAEIKQLLKNKKLLITENLMPRIDEMNLDPAHDAIRSIFMESIIHGKGLGTIMEITGKQPIPTPLALMQLCEALYAENVMDDFMIIDMGGATTDCYSCNDGIIHNDAVILKGIREPRIKRSVEGDLGMRISAQAAYESSKSYIDQLLHDEGLSPDGFKTYLSKIAAEHDYLPQIEQEKAYDKVLAQTAVHFAAVRHSGTMQISYTPSGKRYLQKGKDLRAITSIIGTGGFLCNHPSQLAAAQGPVFAENGNELLLPEKPQYFKDTDYIFPLLGNCAAAYQKETALCAKNALHKAIINLEDS